MRVEESRAMAENLFVGGGSIGALVREHDWSQTSLGTIETWSDELKTAVQIILTELERSQSSQKTQQEAALHQTNRLNAFRVKLTNALRPLTDAIEIQASAARILGESLGATRVIYLEVVSDGEEVIVHKNYTNGVAQLSGRYRLDDYRRNLTIDNQAGHTQVVSDISNNPKYTEAQKTRYGEIDIAAHIDVPLLKNNQFVALLAVHQSTPRQWTQTEVKLVEETVQQTWEAVERSRAEAALRESEAKYRSLFDSIDEGFCIVEMIFDENEKPIDYRFLEINPAFEQQTGLKRAVGKTAHQLVPELEDFWIETYDRVALTGEPVRFESGSATMNRWFDVYACRTGQPEDRKVAILFKDISDRKQAEQKIREQAALLDIATDAIWVHDLDHRLLYWNQGAERLYGWTAKEALGQKANELLSVNGAEMAKNMQTVLKQGEWHGEIQKVTKTGESVMMEGRWTLVRDEADRPKSILCVDTDITKKKQLEAQYYRAQRLESIGTLASGVAHDFNNLLTPILAVAQLLPLKLTNLDEQTRQLLEMLEDSAKRGASLVKQVLSFSRGTEGKRITLQVGHLLSEVVSLAKKTFPKSIEISTEIQTRELWAISADATQIHQVLMNLIINARDAMPNGGMVTIAAKNRYLDQNYARMNLEAQVGFYVLITISDTGIGIPPERLERIFDPFFTTKEVGKGTGLGLATALGIVKNHGGFIKVYSEVGNGTQFQVFLPALEEKQLSQPMLDEELPTGNGELILIVDDEVNVRQITKTSLENYNYKTLLASDGIEALSLYAQHQQKISVVLMDLMMPNLDGLTAIRALQKMNPQIKAIATSGLPTNSQLAFSVNVKTFLLKPYTLQELLNALYQVIICS